MKKRKTIKIPNGALSTRASFSPDTFDADKRTIEVVFSKGAKGKRGFWDPYFEELSMKKSDVRLDRLNLGAPVLNNHQRHNGLEGIIGVVEKAWIRNKEGVALIRFSEREELEGIIKDIQSGVIRNISVGYTVHKYEDVSKKGDEIPTYRATDWEPMEISFVDIPFDKDSQSRSLNEKDSYDCIIETNEENTMNREQLIREAGKKAGLSEETINAMISREFEMTDLDGEVKRALATQTKEVEPKVEPKVEPVRTVEPKVEPTLDADAIRAQATKDEQTRSTGITTVARTLGLNSDVVDKHIKENTSLENFRKLAIESKAISDEANSTGNHRVEVGSMKEQRKQRLDGAESALLNKHDTKNELSEDGKHFRFDNLTTIARKFLESEGENLSGISDADVAERALHSSSDFKEILANVANKTLRDGYELAKPTWQPIVRETEVRDFKEISRTQLHSGAGLSAVKENGEYEHTTMSESAEKYSIQEYGKIIGITRKTLINDDLNAFTRIPSQMGQKARALESKLIWAIIQSNPVMADGNALFSVAHGNLAAVPSVIDIANVNIGVASMELQTDQDDELIDISPEYLVGPSLQRATIKQFLATITPTQNSEANPFSDLSPIIERRLLGTAWYLMASSGMLDMIEIARLEGQSGPKISQKEGFEVSGMKLKVQYDFGAKVIDHRGFFKNAGV